MTSKHQLPRLLIVGGPDIHLRLPLIDKLSSHYEIKVIGSNPDLMPVFEAQAVEYHHFVLKNGANMLSDVASLVQLYRLIKRIRPNIVHAYATKPSVWGRLAAALAGVPIIVGTLPGLGALYVTDTPKVRLQRSIYQLLQRLASGISHATIFQNREDFEQLTGTGIVPPEIAHLIPGSGINVDQFKPSDVSDDSLRSLRLSLGLAPHEKMVIMVSRLVKMKGVMDLVEVAERMGSLRPDIKIFVAGTRQLDSIGSLSDDEFEAMQSALTYLGQRSDIRNFMQLADCLVLPSYYREGIPRVLLEAAAMQLPSVAYEIAGSKEAIEDKVTGFLVPKREIDQLMASIIAACDLEPAEKQGMGVAARDRVLKRFTIERIASMTHALYQQLLESPEEVATRPLRSNPGELIDYHETYHETYHGT